MDEPAPPLRTVARAFEVLDVLWELDGAGPTELAARTGLPKSTAHDYLRTLESTGYVVRREGRYRIGYRFLALGGRLKYSSRFFQTARPELERLAAETGELSSMGIEEAGECVILHAESGENSLDLGIYSGLRTPVHSHATGKVLLAHLPAVYTEEVVGDGELERITEHTITDADTLTDELETIREEGYAADWDQQVIGMGTVAVPVLVGGEVVGSIAVSCPTGRIRQRSYREELVQKVEEAANTVAVNYQYGR